MKRVFVTLTWILTATLICSAQTTFYYPHVANGVLGAFTWKTTILLTNPASSGTASGTITFTRDNSTLGLAGSPLAITLTDEGGVVSTSKRRLSLVAVSASPGECDGASEATTFTV